MGMFQYLCPICGGSEDNTGAEEETVCIIREKQPWYEGKELKAGDIVEGKYNGYGVVPFKGLKLLCGGLEEMGQYEGDEDKSAILVDMYCKSCYTSAQEKMADLAREMKVLKEKIEGAERAMATHGIKRKVSEEKPKKKEKKEKRHKPEPKAEPDVELFK